MAINPPERDAAIIGIACRLPGQVNDQESLWDFCSKAKTATSSIPKTRFNASQHYYPDRAKEGHFYTEAGSFLEDHDVAVFDAPFFGITEAEAKSLDPQQRLLLETTFLALENAGIDLTSIAGRTDVGVFAAGAQIDYQDRFKLDPYHSPIYAATSSAATMFANRLSYFFNLKGPSITVDTACSSALTALHLAAESIKRGECSVAVVGGSCLQISPHMISYFSNLGTLSKTGISNSFDHRASGYGRGEGSVCIIIKATDDAKRDNYAIRAVVRGSGVNHVGRSQGITLPDGKSQADLIDRVYAKAGLNPHETAYVEAHGTGTERGDPIEAESIASGMGSRSRGSDKPLYVGSVKSNFGHLEFASGLVAVLKCIAMLERGVLLPSASFEKANPAINLPELNLKIPTQSVPWPSGVRRVSINNFGFGGSNAHVILEEASECLKEYRGMQTPTGTPQPTEKQQTKPSHQLLVVSAKNEDSLKSYLPELKHWVSSLQNDSHDESVMRRLSYTLCCRRSRFAYRYATYASTPEELIHQLDGAVKISRLATLKGINFIFTGQGAQWPQMGLGLMQFNVFAKTLVEAEQTLRLLGAKWSLREEISKAADCSLIADAAISQPAVTALQISLVSLLRSWNINPSSVCGHSSGEIAAAYAAGFLDLHTSMALAFFRGEASSQPSIRTRPGAMMAVGAAPEFVEPHIASLREGLVTIACYNSPESVTLSGDRPAILELASKLEKTGTFHRILKVDVAYHSDHMIPVTTYYHDKIEQFLSSQTPAERSDCVFYSSINGRTESSAVVTSPWYWVTNLVCPVQFFKAVTTLLSTNGGSGSVSFVEIGPHCALKGPLRDIVGVHRSPESHATAAKAKLFEYSPTLKRGEDGAENMMQLACFLLDSGFDVDVGAIFDASGETTPLLITDLPQYCFDNSRRYWHENRLNTEYDFHGSAWHMLLGHKITGTVGDTLEFRNVFTLDDLPWLRDHKVNSEVLFPAAGYLSMAVEALIFFLRDQLGDAQSRAIVGYSIREITFGKALRLSEGVKNEVFTIVRPQASGTRGAESAGWSSFQILSWTKTSGFVDHCSGMIIAKTREGNVDEVTEVSLALTKGKRIRQLYSYIESSTHSDISPKALYAKLDQIGLSYGPAFARVSHLSTGDDSAVGTVTAEETGAYMPLNFETPLKVHPAILDAFFHVGLLNLGGNKGDLEKARAHVPIFMEELFLSNSLKQSPGDTTKVIVHDALAEKMSRTSSCSLTCFGPGGPDDIAVEIRGFQVFDVQEEKSRDLSTADAINPLTVNWNDHPDFIDSRCLDEWHDDEINDVLPGTEIRDLEKQAYYLIKWALATSIQPPSDSHLHLFWDWMRSVVSNIESEENESKSRLWVTMEDNERWKFIDEVGSRSFQGRLNAKVGRQLPAILSGEADAMNVLFQDEDGLWRVYEESLVFSRSNRQLAQLVDRLGHMNPSLRILEVGAGTGGLASKILSTLFPAGSGPEMRRYEVYDYTDISTGFFENARAKFSDYPEINFSKFDVCKDPTSQGFAGSDYDIILAMDVLHATPDVACALRNIRKLLKPHGVLAMVELEKFSLQLFPFATLPGWWQKEAGPVIKQHEWQELLVDAGFSGIDAAMDDFAEFGMQKIYWTHAKEIDKQHSVPPTVQIIQAKLHEAEEESNGGLATQVKNSLAQTSGRKAGILHISSKIDSEIAGVILLDEHADLLLSDGMNQTVFDALKSLAYYTETLLWVTRTSDPRARFVAGFAKTLQLEYPELKIAVLHLDAEVCGNSASAISKLWNWLSTRLSADKGQDMQQWELEFREVDGRIQIPRLIPDKTLHSSIQRSTGDEEAIEEQPLIQDGRPREVAIGTVGLLSTLHFQDSSVMATPLGKDEVLIRIEATGLNFKDVMIALGSLPWQGLGREASGVVIASGEKVRDELPVGSRVIHWGDVLLATHARGNRHDVVRIPDNLTFEEAASIPVVYTTAYESLVNLARLQGGERVLIHAAAGGVGQAAIMISQWIGAEIFCTVGSPEKKELLIRRYGIPEDRIFSSRNSSFGQALLAVTDNEGVDVILNSLAGDLLRVSWHCIARFGRFVDISKRDAVANAYLEMAPFDKSATYTALDLSLYSDEGKRGRRKLTRDVLDLIEKKVLRPVHPITVMQASELESALRILQMGKHSGKIVIRNDPSTLVKVQNTPHIGNSKLRPDTTCLITGGGGGLGQYLGRWLLENGVKNVIMASRSIEAKKDTKSMRDLMKVAAGHGGVVLPVSCDVASRADVDRVVALAKSKGMPPIRGVIHGAMVLRDSMFETTTLEDWRAVIKPKVNGALNLHHALSDEPLDFFICLSSIVGTLGNAGQSSYAGSNAFLDEFCAWRNAQGLPAASLALPAISDVGYVANMAAGSDGQVSPSHHNPSDLYDFSLTGAEVAHLARVAIEFQRLGSHIVSGVSRTSDLIPSPRLQDTMLSHVRNGLTHQFTEGVPTEQSGKVSLPSEPIIDKVALSRATSLQAASDIILQAMVRKIAKDMMVAPQDIVPESSLAQLGLDSLVAVEFRNWLAKEADAKVRVMEIINSRSLEELVTFVAKQSGLLSRFHSDLQQ